MTSRRGFFQQLASGLVVLAAPRIFVPKVITPTWRVPVRRWRVADIGNFSKWIFPIIRNMGDLDVIDELVSVQPMTAPIEGVMFMDIHYGRNSFLRYHEETIVHPPIGERFSRGRSPDFVPSEAS